MTRQLLGATRWLSAATLGFALLAGPSCGQRRRDARQRGRAEAAAGVTPAARALPPATGLTRRLGDLEGSAVGAQELVAWHAKPLTQGRRRPRRAALGDPAPSA